MRKEPFGENFEGLSRSSDRSCKSKIAEKHVQIAQLSGLTFQLAQRNFFRRLTKGRSNPVASFAGR
jgi:hypothetical protein